MYRFTPRALGHTLLRVGWRFAVYFAVQVVVLAITNSPAWAAGAGAAAAVPMFLVTSTQPDTRTPRFRIPRRRSLVLWAGGLVAVWAAGQALALWLFDVWPTAAANYESHVEQLTATPQTLTLLATIVMAPIAEELLMRGIVYRELRRTLRLSVPVAAVLSSAVFAILHGNLIQAGAVFMLGVFLAFAYEYTHSIIVAIVLHAMFNLLSTFVPAAAIVPLANPAVILVLYGTITLALGSMYVLRR